MQVPDSHVSRVNPFQSLTNHINLSRRPNQDQSERGRARNARLRRIITGNEVILTSESVNDLQETGSGPMLGPYPYFSRQPDSDMEIVRRAPFLHTSPARPVIPDDLSLGSPARLLGGLDPFSVIPSTEGEPIPKKTLMCYCEYSLSSKYNY